MMAMFLDLAFSSFAVGFWFFTLFAQFFEQSFGSGKVISNRMISRMLALS
jgi:hypothetical protein